MISISQIEISLVRAYSSHIREVYGDTETDEGQNSLLKVLCAYEADLHRKIEGKYGSLGYLANVLKPGLRTAAELMDRILKQDPIAMEGWHHGAEASNQIQMVYSLLSSTVLELSKPIIEIEGFDPELKWIFDSEREALPPHLDGAINNKIEIVVRDTRSDSSARVAQPESRCMSFCIMCSLVASA
jgi:hypothetical protein